jgi:hypothetical protein
VLCATLLVAGACATTSPRTDTGPAAEGGASEATDPKTAPILDDATRASIDAFWKAEVDNSTFVPIYIGDRGVAVDGEDAARFDPETGRFADADRKGGAGSLYIQALEGPFEAASKARPLGPDEMETSPILGANVYVEPSVPYQTFVELLYTAGQKLQATSAQGDDSKVVMFTGGGQRLKIVARDGDAWRGFNASSPSLEVGPPDGAPEELELNLTFSISPKGIHVAGDGGRLMPLVGCPEDGPTVCNTGGADATDLIARVSSTTGDARRAALAELVAAYDLRGLYNTSMRIKKVFPDETVFTVSADPDIPFAVVTAVIRAVRDRREGGDDQGHFADDAAFEAAAPPARSFSSSDGLFPDPVFGIAR